MSNMVVLVGRIIEMNDNTISISITRSFKNDEGMYENDKIKIFLWNNLKPQVMEHCKVGDIIGVKGRIQENKDTEELEIIAERVTFLSTRKDENNDKEE